MTAESAAPTPHLDEKTSAAPGVSPEIVRDIEVVLRELYFPGHMEDGLLTPAALTIEELKQTGASVHRAEYAVAERVRASVQSHLDAREKRNPDRQFEAMISAPTAGEIRRKRIEGTGKQVFVVIDTAEIDNPSHASIYCGSSEMSQCQLRKFRTGFLLPVLQNNLMTVEEALEKMGK